VEREHPSDNQKRFSFNIQHGRDTPPNEKLCNNSKHKEENCYALDIKYPRKGSCVEHLISC
jgi:hypothetical protein